MYCFGLSHFGLILRPTLIRPIQYRILIGLSVMMDLTSIGRRGQIWVGIFY
jgi:hypothetical protein